MVRLHVLQFCISSIIIHIYPYDHFYLKQKSVMGELLIAKLPVFSRAHDLFWRKKGETKRAALCWYQIETAT